MDGEIDVNDKNIISGIIYNSHPPTPLEKYLADCDGNEQIEWADYNMVDDIINGLL